MNQNLSKIGKGWRRIVFSGVIGLILGGASVQNATSATIVDWGGTDYVSAATNLALPANSGSGSTAIYAYSPEIPDSPSSGYSTPAGKSGTFYGGSYIVSSSGSAAWHQADIVNAGAGDRLRYNRNASGSQSFSGGAFTAFLKEDFLNGGDASTGAAVFDAASSLSMTVFNQANATHYFAILNDGQWYLSLANTALPEVLSLSGNDLLDSDWSAWSPTGGDGGRLGPVPNFSTTVKGSSFTDIQGVGYFASFSSGVNQAIMSQVTSFQLTAELQAIPEPGSAALTIAAAAILLVTKAFRLRNGSAMR